MSNKYKILELLNEQELTIKEIANQTDFKENEIRVYINRLMKDNLIKEIGKKNRWIIYAAIKNDSLFFLKQLYVFMSNEEKCELKNITDVDIKLLTKIKEMI